MLPSPYPVWLVAILRFINIGGWIPLAVVAAAGSVLAGLRLRKRLMENQHSQGEAGFDGIDDPMLQSVPGLGSAMETDYYSETGSRQAAAATKPARYRTTPDVGRKYACPPQAWKSSSSKRQRPSLAATAPKPALCCQARQSARGIRCCSRNERGSVKISDLGSESGTWVNYGPVSSAGLLLHNGGPGPNRFAHFPV